MITLFFVKKNPGTPTRDAFTFEKWSKMGEVNKTSWTSAEIKRAEKQKIYFSCFDDLMNLMEMEYINDKAIFVFDAAATQ